MGNQPSHVVTNEIWNQSLFVGQGVVETGELLRLEGCRDWGVDAGRVGARGSAPGAMSLQHQNNQNCSAWT